MATYYVSSLAAGGGDGSLASPWTLPELVTKSASSDTSLVAGDEVRIMADGVYNRSASWTFARSAGSASANIVLTGASAAGAVDGSVPTIRATAGTITLLTIAVSHVTTKYLLADGDGQSSVGGITLNANYSRIIRCGAINCSAQGFSITGSNGVHLLRSYATGCSGPGMVLNNGAKAVYCASYGNTNHGFNLVAGTSSASHCLAFGNTGGASNGFNGTSVGYLATQCIAYGNGGDGFDLTGNVPYSSLFAGCIAYGNAGYGFRTTAVASGALLQSCAGGGNTSGDYNPAHIVNNEDFVTLTADPFVDAANGNFNLNDVAGGGALLRPATVPIGDTTAYPFGAWWTGSGGGGSTQVFRPLRSAIIGRAVA